MYLEINGANQHFWQWDVNRQLIVNDAVCGEVHFCNGTTDCALVCAIYEEDGQRLVNVPNILLQSDNPLTAYLYVKGEDECLTQHRQTFKVFHRNKPADYIYTETEIKLWETLDERIKALEENPSSGGITEESDPTVPAWAKRPNKPTYTAEEVGALPADTVIPPSGITEETDPTVQGWAKTSIPAAVGQYFKVSAVDENGNVTAVEAVDAPSGGGGNSGMWMDLSRDPDSVVHITEAVQMLSVSEISGTPIDTEEMAVLIEMPAGVATNPNYHRFNNTVRASTDATAAIVNIGYPKATTSATDGCAILTMCKKITDGVYAYCYFYENKNPGGLQGASNQVFGGVYQNTLGETSIKEFYVYQTGNIQPGSKVSVWVK